MKKILITGLLVFVLALSQTLTARGIIPVGTTQRINVVHEFPETEDYMSSPGRYMDVGILYETFDIVWMPVWVSEDPIIVGVENHNTEEYFDFEPEFTQELLSSHDLIEEDLLSIPFMDKHLGLLVLGGLLIGYLLLTRIKSSDQDEEEAKLTEEDNTNITH